MKSILMGVFLLFFSFFFITGCQDSEENKKEAQKEKIESGTEKMATLLADLHSKIDPMTVSYFKNSVRAAHYKNEIANSADISKQLNNTMFYGYELLQAGQSEEAIRTLEGLLAKLNQMGVNQPTVFYQIKRLLALSYARLGEQNNCIARLNDETCIFPIQGKGIYTLKSSAQEAIRLYEEMLSQKPDDYETIWMLNIAYMTIGEYPEKVPAQWKLPPSAFKSDLELPALKNLSDKLKLNTVALSGGVCVEDFNNDGLLDLFASSWGINDQIRYFVNNGDGSFADKTNETKLDGINGGLNLQHADYNNDGYMDVLVLRGAWFGSSGQIPNSLLKNNGDGTFSDVTMEVGLLSKFPTQTAVWTDFNLDGWLDLFIGNESEKGLRYPCELFISNGDGTFTNKIQESGLGSVYGFVKAVTAGDLNNDGWSDLYISFLDSENKLFLNNGKAGGGITFTDISATAGVTKPTFSFPAWFWDFDNDGFEDIMVACFGTDDRAAAAQASALNLKGKTIGGHPRIYRNKGDDTFEEISQKMGIQEAVFAMGSNFGDLDNDGFLDMYLGTGEPNFTSIVPNKMYRNKNGKVFQDVTTSTRTGHLQKGHGVGFGDFDNDGDQDIFCVLGGAFEGDVSGDAFFLNSFGNENNWITLRLEGNQSNKSAIGAKVKLVCEDSKGKQQTIYRTLSSGGSFGGNSMQLEIGIGKAVKITAVEIRWPNAAQTVETFSGLEINRFVKIVEGQAEVEYLDVKRFSFES